MKLKDLQGFRLIRKGKHGNSGNNSHDLFLPDGKQMVAVYSSVIANPLD